MKGHLRTHNQGHLYTQTRFICTHISGMGVGWARLIEFMFLCTHRHSKPYHRSSLQQTQAPFWGWGGVGWVITFMFLFTHRHSNLIIFLAVLQTQALLLADQLPVGRGGLITFMFLCTHRHTKPLGWSVTAGGGVGGGVITFMFLFTTQAHATWSSFLLSGKHRHYSFMISYRWWYEMRMKSDEMRWDEKG